MQITTYNMPFDEETRFFVHFFQSHFSSVVAANVAHDKLSFCYVQVFVVLFY